jgi:hypothetical protein
METIQEGTQVKYIGKTNNYTYTKDISENSNGIVKKVIEVDGITSYEVEFDNGIITSIESKLFDLVKSV